MTSKHNKKTKKSNSKIGICHYHLCRKKTRVYRCKYCGEYFCKKHFQPKPPGLPRFNSTKHEDRLFMEEWHKPGGHPCVPYLDIWRAEQERKEQEYRQALDMLLRSKPLRTHHELEVISREKPTKRNASLTEKIENYWYWNKREIMK
ncbi:AN1-type zinc finger domain-containing protein, partial [Candidatus Woesearchaeota archaeon]|nr:AN1-type zinc finger domain-containing protein [Candidatus Woesearchaeota archaeon]